MASGNKRSYYKRELAPSAIPFSSAEGRQIFSEALAMGTMVGFFKLIEQFTTQEEPSYCGLAALSMTLNALGVDPRRLWKGAWRWFSEGLLDCAKAVEQVAAEGITLNQVASLARCNGADVSLHRHGSFDGATFRRLLAECCGSEAKHMIVSYSRKAFAQSGDGHFSPVGGYHAGRDLALILDVARFKYAPHWVRVDELMEAMGHTDPAIGRPRGFMLLSRRTPRESALFAISTPPPLSPPLSPPLPPPLASELRSSPAVCIDACDPTPHPQHHNHQHHARDNVATGGGEDTMGCTGKKATGPAVAEPVWAAAHRFLTLEAPAMIRAALDPDQHQDLGHDHEPGHDGEDAAEEDGAAEADVAAAAAGNAHKPAAVPVPKAEDLVWSLVQAAPLDSICAMLTQRPTAPAAGLPLAGPCCPCVPPGPTAAPPAAAAAAGAAPPPEPRTPPRAGSAVLVTAAAPPPPCNSGCAGQHRHHHPVGSAGRAGGGHSPFGASPPSGPAAAAAAAADAGSAASGAALLAAAASALAAGAGAAAAAADDALDSAGSESSCGSAHTEASSCCHGEPLEHHCVPPQVQALTLGELRFTAMHRLVAHCLRRQRGCSHSPPPDLDAFMRPAGAAPAPAPAAPSAGTAAGTAPAAAPASGAACGAMAGTGACTGPAAAVKAATGAAPSAGAGAGAGATATPGHCGAASAGPQAHAQAAASAGPQAAAAAAAAAGECGCGDLGLPPMAAEKLATALLLLDLPPLPDPAATAAAAPASAAATAAPDSAPAVAGVGAAAAAGGSSGGGGVRVCGRPRCRRCRRRAAAAGDRAAALALLREGWRTLASMAPLGLFGSSPVLRDELSYVRLQLSYVQPVSCAAVDA
ncbi:hypothetical protein HYH03_014563 [Edaphochlamys debaryana]|uniref:glutathione gamma-glutamylcysteinyltransferase n=1 Tax=Edaphochlamys debaryana TaxID=47281 RepID=A0A835XNG8_9CHLO|nr:hypothetical protein HYH03_014563 [Edaphochlamys debaryana]|eukprot:KAG2486764.1 hypothetical protein HYH03_014563 [Edaphochlamys debaryana]